MDLKRYQSNWGYGAWVHGRHPETLEINNHYPDPEDSIRFGGLIQYCECIRHIVFTGHFEVHRSGFQQAHALLSVRLEQPENSKYPVKRLYFPDRGDLPEAHGFEARPGIPDWYDDED